MKRSLVFLSLLILMAVTLGCQNQQAIAELEELKAQAEIEEQNKELVRKMFDVFVEWDLEAYQELLAPEFVFYYPSGNPNPMSKVETIELLKVFGAAFPDINTSMELLFAEGDEVAFTFIQRGTHEGEFMGIPPTGKQFESSGILYTRVEDGRIVEQREEFDMLGLYQQLGMELRPAE